MTKVVENYARSITLRGCGNFRDLGGYETMDGRTTRWRTLFRSDSVHWLTDDDVTSLSGQGITLATGFDLRSAAEIETYGIGPLYSTGGTRHLNMPFVKELGDATQYESMPKGLGDLYITMIEGAQECIGSFFQTLAEQESYPLVYYCAAGKDRTGIITALLLRMLGVSDGQIAADYALTETLMLETLTERLRLAGRVIAPELLLAKPETITGFLHTIDQRYGCVTTYLEECGVERATLEALRSHLLLS